jgi:arylsulfatase A-like enzyme
VLPVRCLAAGLLSLICLPAVAQLAGCGDGGTLPKDVTIERVVAELAPPLAPGASATGAGASGVRRTVLNPGDRVSGGGRRDALAAPAPSRLRFRIAVQPDTVLRFSAGVGRSARRRAAPHSGVVFRVHVDGHAEFERTLDPVVYRRHRRWMDGEVDLRPWAGQSVDVTLDTTADDPSRPVAGTPGWSRVRVVHQEHRPRQAASAGVNVLFLLIDTLRADQLGVYGASPSPSPTLDRLASRGTVFDVAVAQSSWTMPAVASIFTGLHPRSHGAVGLDAAAPATHAGAGTLLPDALVTMAEVAEGAGISTFGVSTNLLIDRATNLAQGFETFTLLPFNGRARNYVSAPVVNRRLGKWLRRARGFRFFAYLHYMEPHGPYTPPAARRPAPPEGISADLAEGWVRDVAMAVNERRMSPPSPATIAYLMALYDGDIRSWDDAFAALLRRLDAAGLLEHTIIVVTADHGEEFLEHGNLTHGEHVYEETLRIPLVIAGPGIPAQRRTDVAQQIDLLPTVAALLGAPPPAGLPGRDLFATDRSDGVISEIVAGFGDRSAGRGTVALRTARWKLIRAPVAPDQLYDLSQDPHERTNVAARMPETVSLLAARLARATAAAAPPPRAYATDPGLRERLQQLGYAH